MDLTIRSSKIVRPDLLQFYATKNVGQNELHLNLEKFLGTPHFLLILGECNIICEARLDCVGSQTDRKGRLLLPDLLIHLDPYRLELPEATI